MEVKQCPRGCGQVLRSDHIGLHLLGHSVTMPDGAMVEPCEATEEAAASLEQLRERAPRPGSGWFDIYEEAFRTRLQASQDIRRQPGVSAEQHNAWLEEFARVDAEEAVKEAKRAWREEVKRRAAGPKPLSKAQQMEKQWEREKVLVVAVLATLVLGGFWAANNTSWGCELTGGKWLPAESWTGPAAGKFDDMCWRTGGSSQRQDPGDCEPGLPRSLGGC